MKCFLTRAFTLVEFLTVLAIAAIFVTIAVPGYQAMIQNNKIVSAANKLSASLNLARMEAVKRGVPIAVCPAANAAFSACGSSSQWSQGWIVFLDEDKDNQIDSQNDLIKVAQGITNDAQLNTSVNVISYDSAGFLSSGASTLSLSTPDCTGNNGRIINISTSGRVSITAAACN